MQKEKEQTFSDKEKSPSLCQREGTEGRECQYEPQNAKQRKKYLLFKRRPNFDLSIFLFAEELCGAVMKKCDLDSTERTAKSHFK